jgi:dTDP-4-dehydrorhamnose 3,5-epimerase-like enzyme
MNKTSINDCRIIDLDMIHNRSGNITVVSQNDVIPFSVKRIYYLYDIPGGVERGGHAHKELFQLIVAASGSFDVELDDGSSKKQFTFNRPYKGLLVTPGIWREIINFSSGSICLVLASAIYDEADYIRDYDKFLTYKKE